MYVSSFTFKLCETIFITSIWKTYKAQITTEVEEPLNQQKRW
jgi:hypothetical protein